MVFIAARLPVLRGRPTAPTLHPLDRSDIRCPPADKSDGAPPSTSPCAILNPLNREACDLTLGNPLLGQAQSAGQLLSHSALAIVRRVEAFDPELESMPSTNSPAALITATLTARGASGARRGCPSTSHKESRYRHRLRFDHIRASIWPPALFA